VKNAILAFAFIMAITGCTSSGIPSSSYIPLKQEDTITYCETFGGKKYCQQVHHDYAVDKINNFLVHGRRF